MTKKSIFILGVIAVLIILIFALLSKEINAPLNEENVISKASEKIVKGTSENSSKTSATNQSQSVNNNNKPMQLEIKTTKEGTGERQVKNGDTISVHYTGKLTDGTKFDSSVDRGVPFEFTVGQGMVIQGWEKGFIGAKVGEKRTLTIPAEMGYGARAVGSIPANSTLIFDVELVAIK